MPDLRRLLVEDEVLWVRQFAEFNNDQRAEMKPQTPRIWGPISNDIATGRASCRACGQKIEQDTRVISFGFDAIGDRVVRAYIHAVCP